MMKRLFAPAAIILLALVTGLAGFTAWSLYPHPHPAALPTALLTLDSDAGIARLARASASADYPALAAHFEPQVAISFCGVASSVAVLNALGHSTTQASFFNRQTEPVRRAWQILFGGMDLDALAGLLAAHGVSATAHHADTFTTDEFREVVQRNLATAGDYLLVNYQRAVLGQGKSGHISPIAAYDGQTDSVLVMDTSAHKYPPTWVPLPLLVNAMHTVDETSGKMRGFVEVTRAAH